MIDKKFDVSNAQVNLICVVTAVAPGHAATPVAFSPTCRKRHLGDMGFEKATS